jgi:hypothetical protein
MRTTALIALIALLAMVSAGCSGNGKLQTRGQVVKGGKPLALPQGEYLRVIFIPIVAEGRYRDTYVAEYNREDATFRVAGKDLKGMPPGKYKIMVEHLRGRNDLLRGAYDEDRTPFEFEVRSSSDFVTVDMDKASKPAAMSTARARDRDHDQDRGMQR